MRVDVSMSTDPGKPKHTRLPLRSRLPLLECVVVCICELEHTYQCVSRLQEYWSLSRTHSTAAGDRATCIMLQSGLSVPAAHSHTRSRANLHRGDIWLHQQVGRSHFRHFLSALQRLGSLQNPPRQRSTSHDVARFQVCLQFRQPPPELPGCRCC